MKIAMLGTRGVPAAYSGFETAVENIGARLSARGHQVTVYCRPHMVERQGPIYRGMRLVYLPTIASKHLDTWVHTFVSTLHMATVDRPDVAFYFIAGNSPLAGLGRALGVPSALNVDGLDSQRAKWRGAARTYLRWAERTAPRLATVTITDSRTVQDLYRRAGHKTVYIPYGCELSVDEEPAGCLERFGLEPRKYILFVHRLVPENNAHVLVDAFCGLDTELKLVLVGDAPYATEYQTSLRACEDRRVIFTGYQFGAAYRELLSNAAIFVAPTEVGGTHPVILEAMGAGNCVVVNDHAPNIETVGDAGIGYPAADGAAGLRRVLAGLLADGDTVSRCRKAAAERACALFSWESVTDAYEDLAGDLVRAHARGHRDRRAGG